MATPNEAPKDKTGNKQDEPGSTGTNEPETGGTDPQGNDPDPQSDTDESKLSQKDALAALDKVRRSEAKYRTRLRELEERFKDAKTPEEHAAVIEELNKSNAKDSHDLLVENVSLRFGITPELQPFLQGSTREELVKSAEVLAKHANLTPPTDPDLSGGLDPNDDADDEFDPIKAARAARNRRY